MPRKPNYNFEKRAKEDARKAKKDAKAAEKLQRKRDAASERPAGGGDEAGDGAADLPAE
jgi:hypothetical protein